MKINTSNQYGTLTKLFHWSTALLFIGMFTVGYIMQDMAASPQKWQLYKLHKATGFTYLLIVISYLFWRIKQKTPGLPKTLPQWQRKLAVANIHLLFMLIVLMPLTGYFMSSLGGREINYFDLFNIPAITKSSWGGFFHDFHIYASYVVIFCVSLHVLAALYHHFIKKDTILKRMLP